MVLLPARHTSEFYSRLYGKQIQVGIIEEETLEEWSKTDDLYRIKITPSIKFPIFLTHFSCGNWIVLNVPKTDGF